MEFDKSRVYTALNADELKAGDKVIVADDMASLRTNVEDNQEPFVLMEVLIEDERARFRAKKYTAFNDWLLAYLVERKENCTNCGNYDDVFCSGVVELKKDKKLHRCAEYKPKTEPKTEPHYRPFKDTDELIKVWGEKAKATPPVLDMPYIWVRSKFNKAHKGCLITNFFGIYVLMNNQQCFLSRLFDEYTFLDGSPCGVEE